jgi:hypothetical protein
MNLAILMCIAGFALHFLGRYGEHLRVAGKITPLAYVLQDPTGWASALIGTAVTMVALPELGPLLGLKAEATPLTSLFVGYVGSSLSAKLPALLTGNGSASAR